RCVSWSEHNTEIFDIIADLWPDRQRTSERNFQARFPGQALKRRVRCTLEISTKVLVRLHVGTPTPGGLVESGCNDLGGAVLSPDHDTAVQSHCRLWGR